MIKNFVDDFGLDFLSDGRFKENGLLYWFAVDRKGRILILVQFNHILDYGVDGRTVTLDNKHYWAISLKYAEGTIFPMVE